MGNLIYPVVPVAIHQTFVDAACGLIEAGIKLVEVLWAFDGDGADVDQGLAVGSQFEALEAAFTLGHHALLGGGEVQGKNFCTTAEHYRVIVHPNRIELALGGGGQADGLVAIDPHQVQFGVVFVLLHIGVAKGKEHLATIGADSIFAHHTEAPHHFGRESAVLHSHLGLPNRLFVRLLRLAGHQA